MEDNLIEMNQKINLNDFHDKGMELSWHKISVWTKTKKSCFGRKTLPSTQILNSVSGMIEPGQLLAVMGPSGSGKTTLLNTLTGRNLISLNVQGLVLINKHRAKIETIKSISGYVQQGDLFVPMLTVEEYLIFMSLVRMDRKCSKEERKQRIEQIMDELELTKCSKCRIGNRYDDIIGSGISGGELRRLSFAAEMLNNPSILFCDEPTSGLDSYLAENVVKILKKMSESGRTILCTIHQPSSDVFILFDKLLLLTQGRLAFIGSPQEAQQFFSQLNLQCPINFNPADFYLKQISIIPTTKKECLEKINRICDTFNEKFIKDFDNKYYSTTKDFRNNSSEESLIFEESSEQQQQQQKKQQKIYKASWFEQFNALLWRSFISNIREPMIIRIKLTQTLTVALLLGIVYWNQKLDQKGIMNINGAIFILIINLTFMNVFSVINTFCSELPIFLREYNNGMYRVDTYFLAKMLSELPYQLIFPTIFISIMYYMIGFYNSLENFLLFLLLSNLIANCGISFGYMISCLASTTKMAIAISSPLILPLLLFGGYFLNNSTIPVYFLLFKYLSWFYYGNEAMIITQWSNIKNISCPTTTIMTDSNITANNSTTDLMLMMENQQKCLLNGKAVISELGFNEMNLTMDILALILLIIFMRFIAFLSLYSTSKIR